jgi:hypothetical protein
MKLQARSAATNKAPSTDEYYNMLLAQKAMQSKAQETDQAKLDALRQREQEAFEASRKEIESGVAR